MLLNLQKKLKTPCFSFSKLHHYLTDNKKQLLPLCMIFIFLFYNTLNAQIVVTDKQQTIGTGMTISLFYTIPAGADRLLLVSAGSEMGPTSVEFDGVGMTQVGTSALGTLWTKVLGTDVTTATSGTIVFTVASSAQYIGINAISFTGVDQTIPVSGFDQVNIAANATSSTLSIVSKTDDMVLDGVFAGCTGCFAATPTATEAAEQAIQNTNNITGFFGGSSATSTKAGATSVTMNWGFSGTAVASGIHTGINIVNVVSLPIELSYFSAQSRGKKVMLKWETLSEINNKGFEVQRSTDGTSFENIAVISGKGNSSSIQIYELLDEFPPEGKIYYRLKQVDYNGAFEYSPVKTTEILTDVKQLKFAPNPAIEGITTLYFTKASNGEALLEIFNLTGQTIYQHPVSLNRDSETIVSINLSDLASGIYIAKLEVDGEIFSEKLILE